MLNSFKIGDTHSDDLLLFKSTNVMSYFNRVLRAEISLQF